MALLHTAVGHSLKRVPAKPEALWEEEGQGSKRDFPRMREIERADFAPTKGVMRMGNGRWTQVLRILVSFIIALAMMILTAQKAC